VRIIASKKWSTRTRYALSLQLFLVPFVARECSWGVTKNAITKSDGSQPSFCSIGGSSHFWGIVRMRGKQSTAATASNAGFCTVGFTDLGFRRNREHQFYYDRYRCSAK
jgi:hypothetical protein